MSNEELTIAIQDGERDRLVELWVQVERFVVKKANRRLESSGGLGGVEFDDLRNAGYLALVAAADTFDPEAGMSFVGWLALKLKDAFAEAGTGRSQKQTQDPLHRAGSLDAPVGEDEDSGTLAEVVPDPAAVQAFEDIDRREDLRRLRSALLGVLSTLPAEQRSAVVGRYWHGQQVPSRELNKAMRALRHPRIAGQLRAFL